MKKWRARLIIVVILSLPFVTIYGLWRTYIQPMQRVKVSWENDTLYVSSMSGGKIVTHLVGESNHKTAIAILDKPYVFFDSACMKFDKVAFKKLDWRSIEGEKLSAPPIHSKIRALYYQPQYSEWEGVSFPKDEGEDG